MTALDIIIVSYNTADLTIRAIESVYTQTQHPFNLIVVDNASQDGSAEKIRQRFDELTLIESGRNLGFARGVNLGAKYAQTDYILLLNPDTVILDGAIDKLLNFAEAYPKNGIWGGLTLNNDLSINRNNAWAFDRFGTLLLSAIGISKLFPNNRWLNHHNYGNWQRDSIKTVDIIQGSFFLTSRRLWQQLQGLDSDFFMYGEEADYCYRAKQRGYQAIVSPEPRIIHHGGASEKQAEGKITRLLTGKCTFIDKHHHLQTPLLKGLLWLYVFNQWIIAYLQSLFNRQKRLDAQTWASVLKNSRTWLKGYQTPC